MTLCTSDINISRRAAKTAFVYLLFALFCMFFGAVYELFSHEVYSFYMIYAFAFLLVGGTLPFFIISLLEQMLYPGTFARNLYHSGIATFTVGSIIQGVLDIYGTTNSLTRLYWYIGGSLILLGIVSYVVQMASTNRISCE